MASPVVSQKGEDLILGRRVRREARFDQSPDEASSAPSSPFGNVWLEKISSDHGVSDLSDLCASWATQFIQGDSMSVCTSPGAYFVWRVLQGLQGPAGCLVRSSVLERVMWRRTSECWGGSGSACVRCSVTRAGQCVCCLLCCLGCPGPPLLLLLLHGACSASRGDGGGDVR